MSSKAVFIDRDGTMIFDHGYIRDPKKVEILPNVIDALGLLLKNGFLVFVVTNQSGIGRGMMTVSDVDNVNNRMLELIGRNKIKEILMCPHGPEENCPCRKPGTKLVEEAAKKYKLDLLHSYSVGDKDCDKELGQRFGGFGIKLGEHGINDLLDAVNFILKKENK